MTHVSLYEGTRIRVLADCLRFQNWIRGVGRGLYAVFRIGPAGEFVLFFQCGLPGLSASADRRC